METWFGEGTVRIQVKIEIHMEYTVHVISCSRDVRLKLTKHIAKKIPMTFYLITGTPRAVPCQDLVDPCRAKYFRAVPL